MNRVILASASPRRVELLKTIVTRFKVFPSSVDEELSEDSPSGNASRLALEKASRVAMVFRNSVVIGADTVVSLNGTIFGKPLSKDDAISILRSLQGKEHEVTTGVAVLKGRHQVVDFETSRVCFKKLTDAEIIAYVDTGEPMDKAGAYAIQGKGGDMVVKTYSGSYSNIVGLPVELLKKIMKDEMFSGHGERWG